VGTAAPGCPSSAARQLAGGVSNAREPTVAIPAKYACRTARSAITCLVLTMDPGPQSAAFKPRPVRNLLLLGALFIVGFVCSRSLRFNYSLFNYIFGWAVLCIPFFALRPILQLGKLSGFIGLILASPILLISLLLILTSVACDFDLHPYTKGSCLQDLGRIEQSGYSVHLILDEDCAGGALSSVSLYIEQRRRILPGIYIFRMVDSFPESDGQIRSAGTDSVYAHIPSAWRHQPVDHIYLLKKHVYF